MISITARRVPAIIRTSRSCVEVELSAATKALKSRATFRVCSDVRDAALIDDTSEIASLTCGSLVVDVAAIAASIAILFESTEVVGVAEAALKVETIDRATMTSGEDADVFAASVATKLIRLSRTTDVAVDVVAVIVAAIKIKVAIVELDVVVVVEIVGSNRLKIARIESWVDVDAETVELKR